MSSQKRLNSQPKYKLVEPLGANDDNSSQATRRVSSRQQGKQHAIMLPDDHVFLVFFDIDQKYDLICASNNRWPAYLSNVDNLGLQHGDKIEYKTGRPSVTHSGETITQGPVNVVSKVASWMNDRLLDGLKVNELDITVQYEYWRQKLEGDDVLEVQHEVEPPLKSRKYEEPGQQSEEAEKLTADLPDLSDELDSVLGENCCHRCNRLDEVEKVNIQLCSLGGASRQSFNLKI